MLCNVTSCGYVDEHVILRNPQANFPTLPRWHVIHRASFSVGVDNLVVVRIRMCTLGYLEALRWTGGRGNPKPLPGPSAAMDPSCVSRMRSISTVQELDMIPFYSAEILLYVPRVLIDKPLASHNSSFCRRQTILNTVGIYPAKVP